MSSTYLAPYRIISEGLTKRTLQRWGTCQTFVALATTRRIVRTEHAIRAELGRILIETHGTGEHSPIDQFERLLAFFSVHNRTAAILMCEGRGLSWRARRNERKYPQP